MRRRGASGIALVDLDHFKRINDQHGHRAGDLALQAFARACTAVLRTDDVVARWGGEEFLVLFPGLSPGTAQLALDRLGAHLAGQPLDSGLH
ncbi:MAG: GGDEF domain-containing protein, partial [Aquabacterium sp.]